MKIGITSQNLRTITGHAGKTRRFLVYELDPAQGSIQPLAPLELPKEMSLHAYHGPGRHPVADLDVLITAGCGEGFAKRMGNMGVRLLVTGESDPMTAVRAVANGAPLPPPLPQAHQHH